MNIRNVSIVYHKELTEWLRDRRTLISTVLVPLLAFPVLMVGMTSLMAIMMGKAEKEAAKVMVIGGEDSPELLEKLRKDSELEIVPSTSDYKKQITEKEIRAAVEVPKGFDSSLNKGEPQTVSIYYYEGEIKSSFGVNHVEQFFNDYRDSVVSSRLASRNLPGSILKPFEVKKENVAPPEKVSGAALGGLLGYMVILLSMTGAIYPAIDLTAGEKERGTMETILSSPLSRVDLVLGKFFLVLSASLSTAILSVISMGTSFYLVGNSGAMAKKDAAVFQLHIGLQTVLSVFLMALPLAVLFAAALLTIALFAKSYKEAQSYLTPMTFIVVIPAVASLLPGFELTPKLALVPILSTSLVCKEIVAGTFHWNYILLILLSSCVYAAAALFIAVKTFQRESVLFRS
ncbi:MAG TPA: ABC transporter permease [Candidatus Acidoferrum sp.]|nr:ABC transporter permease [Candidatus Acidoferrum sp.]